MLKKLICLILGFSFLKAMEIEFLEAAKNGDLVKVKQFVEKQVDVNFQDDEGNSALIHAAHNINNINRTATSNTDLVKFLLDSGANVNIQNNELHTALTWTIVGKATCCRCIDELELEIMKLLIDYGADVDHRTHDGCTLLMSCLGFDEVANLLLEAGADPTIKNIYGYDSIHYAKRQRRNSLLFKMYKRKIKRNCAIV